MHVGTRSCLAGTKNATTNQAEMNNRKVKGHCCTFVHSRLRRQTGDSTGIKKAGQTMRCCAKRMDGLYFYLFLDSTFVSFSASFFIFA